MNALLHYLENGMMRVCIVFRETESTVQIQPGVTAKDGKRMSVIR